MQGSAHRVALDGEHAYLVGEGMGLEVARVLTPIAPEVRGHYPIEGHLWGIRTDGDLAFVTGEVNGLQIFDISALGAPKLLSQLATRTNARGLDIDGDYAFVGDHRWSNVGGWTGLHVIDIADPEAPQIIGSLETPHPVYDIEVDGDIAFLAAASVRSVNISDPHNPVFLDTVDEPLGANALTRQGSILYVAHSGGRSASLQIIDASDPAALTPIGRIEIGGFSGDDVLVSGNYAFVLGDFGVSTLYVIDVHDPSHPTLVAETFVGDSASQMSMAGNRLYVADTSHDLVIIDVANPLEPVPLRLSFSRWDAVAVSLAGDQALVLGWQTIFASGETPRRGLRTYRIAEHFSLDLDPPVATSVRAIPSPFREWTELEFEIPLDGRTNVTIHDATGRRVRVLRDGESAAGRHRVLWDGQDASGRPVPAGVYWIRINGVSATEGAGIVRIR